MQAFHERKLEERYVCIYLDATHIPIRRQTVEKEAVYIAIGITEEGNKEVLDFTIAPTESSHVWEELIQGLTPSVPRPIFSKFSLAGSLNPTSKN